MPISRARRRLCRSRQRTSPRKRGRLIACALIVTVLTAAGILLLGTAIPSETIRYRLSLEAEIDGKQKLMGEMQNNFSTQLGQALALQTSNYLQGVYEVTAAKPKKELANVVEDRKLDYELLDRWVKYMAKPTEKYKNKEAWQAFIKKGGKPDEAKKLAEKFQEDVVAAMLTRNELNDENKVIADKAMEDGDKQVGTTHPVRRREGLIAKPPAAGDAAIALDPPRRRLPLVESDADESP